MRSTRNCSWFRLSWSHVGRIFLWRSWSIRRKSISVGHLLKIIFSCRRISSLIIHDCFSISGKKAVGIATASMLSPSSKNPATRWTPPPIRPTCPSLIARKELLKGMLPPSGKTSSRRKKKSRLLKLSLTNFYQNCNKLSTRLETALITWEMMETIATLPMKKWWCLKSYQSIQPGRSTWSSTKSLFSVRSSSISRLTLESSKSSKKLVNIVFSTSTNSLKKLMPTCRVKRGARWLKAVKMSMWSLRTDF